MSGIGKWQQQAEKDLGSRLTRLNRVGGGDFAESYSAVLESGARVFVKTHSSPPPNHFSTEATGLRWLHDAAAVPVPEVLGVSDDPPFLAIEWIEEGHGNDQTEVNFGAALASLHKNPGSCFGREDKRSTGSLGLPNEPCADWATFYGSQRLLPLVRIAQDRGALPDDCLRRIERLAAILPEFADNNEPAARLHGDLWAGNRLIDQNGVSWLIDPAAHGGHREFDLAMMRLFGGFGDAAFRAYHENYPLAPGWEERVLLHQLAPLIVHAIKFGGHYVGSTVKAVQTYC